MIFIQKVYKIGYLIFQSSNKFSEKLDSISYFIKNIIEYSLKIKKIRLKKV